MLVPSAVPEDWKLSCACDMVTTKNCRAPAADQRGEPNERLNRAGVVLNLGTNGRWCYTKHPCEQGNIAYFEVVRKL